MGFSISIKIAKYLFQKYNFLEANNIGFILQAWLKDDCTLVERTAHTDL